jgi:voltage-gated potassium channel
VVGAFDLFWEYLKTSWELASDRRVRPAFVIIGLLVAIGTVFYKFVEHWTWLDALYFSVIALSTVGFGDVTPETRLGKLFTIVYIVVGIGIFFVVINSIARIASERMHMSLRPPHRTRICYRGCPISIRKPPQAVKQQALAASRLVREKESRRQTGSPFYLINLTIPLRSNPAPRTPETPIISGRALAAYHS